MRCLAAAVILSLSACSLWAIEVKDISIDPVEHVLTITKPNGQQWSRDYTNDLPLDAADLAALRDLMQEEVFDTKIVRSQLPSNDPDRSTDPNNECSHHTGPGQRIVYRSTVVVQVTTDATGNPVPHLRDCIRSLPPL